MPNRALMNDQGSINAMHETESQPLLQKNGLTVGHARLLLPIALLASLGITATAATSVFAYAYLLCADPTHCQNEERAAYAGTLALATTVANVCAILAVGPLHLLGRRNAVASLLLWFGARGASVAVLSGAVALRSIPIAIASKVLEGLATDNILQYGLGAVYARLPSEKHFSAVMGHSMAVYLFGSALGPILAGLSTNFRTSFVFAVVVFVIAGGYTSLIWVRFTIHHTPSTDDTQETAPEVPKRSLLDHVRVLAEPALLLPGVSLLLYTMAQGYVFPALMVHTALRFGFTGRENGWMLSLAAGTSAVALMAVPSALGAVERCRGSIPRRQFNLAMAVATMGVFAASLILLARIDNARLVYPAIMLFSIGLASSTYIKGYAVLCIPGRADVMPALAVQESVGSLLSPLLIGAAQTRLAEGEWLYISAGVISFAALLLVLSGRS
ncbi:hypothetical protein ASPZODRAFT_167648 [Penicilliopsis zonata CBS 506.65]|uniref:Major facilitator superfamily (MFS) profile domain-containing protein n=1 Tax=Penicilliopsis zonata CBS 506.65 TaxID=1073090 RepID=A0A1L9SFK9_9EURO|nr:hypothetical protein ASPZODRAFT_167648 [Penicilliopsis zonata CBS 506.65]OJJ45952.1 hypothetical protein ASPZODRAFT_167648 [Penicilliopsis zonata CBS 506.65]